MSVTLPSLWGAGRAILSVWSVEPWRSSYSSALLQYERNFGCGGWTRSKAEQGGKFVISLTLSAPYFMFYLLSCHILTGTHHSQWGERCGGHSKVFVCKHFITTKLAYELKVRANLALLLPFLFYKNDIPHFITWCPQFYNGFTVIVPHFITFSPKYPQAWYSLDLLAKNIFQFFFKETHKKLFLFRFLKLAITKPGK